MIVFEYMYDNMDVFGHHMDQWATGKRRHIGNEDDSMVRTIKCLTLLTVDAHELPICRGKRIVLTPSLVRRP